MPKKGTKMAQIMKSWTKLDNAELQMLLEEGVPAVKTGKEEHARYGYTIFS